MREIVTAKAQKVHCIVSTWMSVRLLLDGFLVALLFAGFTALVVRDFVSLIPYNRWTGGALAHAFLISFRIIPSLLLFWLVFGWRSLPARCIHVATATMVWLVMDQRLQQWWRLHWWEDDLSEFRRLWGRPLHVNEYAAEFAGLLAVMFLLAVLSGIRLRRFPGDAERLGWRFSLREGVAAITALAILLGIGSQEHLPRDLPLEVAVTCCCGWCMLRGHALPLRILLMFLLCCGVPDLLNYARYVSRNGDTMWFRSMQWEELAQAVGLFLPLLAVRMLGYRLAREKGPGCITNILGSSSSNAAAGS